MNKSYHLFLGVVVCALFFFSSCKKDPVDDPVTPPTVNHELLDDYVRGLDGVSILSHEERSIDEVLDKVLSTGMFSAFGDMSVMISGLVKAQLADTLAAWNARYGFNATDVRVHGVSYRYQTIDHQGNPRTLSSYVTWVVPVVSNPKEKAVHNRIVLFSPFSQTKEDYCATATYGGAAIAMLAKDALIVAPDPQGFGYDKNHDQMYMNNELIGRQMADAMAAAYKVFLDYGYRLTDDFFLTPMGMSQGAATSVAVQRYLENTSLTLASQSHTLADWWHFGYTYAACGPYSPEATMDDYLAWQTNSHPVVFPLVLKTMIQSYPQVFDNVGETVFYADNYLPHKPFFDSIYLYKPYTVEEINDIMFRRLSTTPDHPNTLLLSDMLSADLLDATSSLQDKFRQCLRRNDLTTGWSPRHNIYIEASDADDYVPFSNAQALQRLSSSKVHLLNVGHGTHQVACGLWLLNAFGGTFDSQLVR